MSLGEPRPENLEICFNLWVVVDEQTNLVYSYMGKAYGLRGTREDKFRVLQALAAHDHYTVPKRKLPDRLVVTTGGDTIKGATTMAGVRDPKSGFWSELLDLLVNELPAQVNFVGDHSISSRIPVENPLCLVTVLLESKHGVTKPQIGSTVLQRP